MEDKESSGSKRMKDKSVITKEKAKEIILFYSGMAHTFYNASFGLIGGDHSKAPLYKDIDNAFELRITGKQALNMGHGLAILPLKNCKQSEILFVETNTEFNKKELKKLGVKNLN